VLRSLINVVTATDGGEVAGARDLRPGDGPVVDVAPCPVKPPVTTALQVIRQRLAITRTEDTAVVTAPIKSVSLQLSLH